MTYYYAQGTSADYGKKIYNIQLSAQQDRGGDWLELELTHQDAEEIAELITEYIRDIRDRGDQW